MTTDAYGLPVSTGSPAAGAAYDRAVHGLMGWDGAALDLFQATIAQDPGFALGHAGAGVCLFLDERFGEARAALTQARERAAGAAPRERGHVEALALLVTGKVAEAEAMMREHLAAWPRDLVIAQRLYFIWLLPLIAGLHAFARAEYADTVRAIEPLTPRIVQLGGSRAQRDVFHDTLLEACFRAGDMDRAERLLAIRVARRPDHHWTTRATRSAAS
jgi:hypothetical protein